MFNKGDWVEVLKEDCRPFNPAAPVAHFGRIVSSDTSTSEVELEVWGRPNSYTIYFPLKFSNDRLVKR